MNDLHDKVNFILSYGGGVNSTALLIYLIENKLPLDYVVFADTGNEMPETYEYLKVIRAYLHDHKMEMTIVYPARKISLFIRCFKRKVIPSQLWRWCTRDVKVLPIHRFYKKLGSNIVQYMGIHYDEIWRMKSSGEDWITNSYPLIDKKINQSQCIELIRKANLPVPIKSGCFFCPFNDKKRWQYIKENHPDLYQQTLKLERNGKHYPNQKLIVIKQNSDSICDGVCMT